MLATSEWKQSYCRIRISDLSSLGKIGFWLLGLEQTKGGVGRDGRPVRSLATIQGDEAVGRGRGEKNWHSAGVWKLE